MKTKLKIIKLFIEDKAPKTIREIAKHIHADYKITHTAAQLLIKENVLSMQTIGKSSLCRLNNSCYAPEIYQAEYERTEHILRKKSLKQLHKEIMSKVGTSFFVWLLFGSHAKGKETKSSDIDILFISNEKDFESKISNIIAVLPLKIHALTFTEEEFIRMKDAKKANVIQEAMEKNIIMYGIETYYRLKNA